MTSLFYQEIISFVLCIQNIVHVAIKLKDNAFNIVVTFYKPKEKEGTDTLIVY